MPGVMPYAVERQASRDGAESAGQKMGSL